MYGDAKLITNERNGIDVSADGDFPYGAVVEADTKLAEPGMETGPSGVQNERHHPRVGLCRNRVGTELGCR